MLSLAKLLKERDARSCASEWRRRIEHQIQTRTQGLASKGIHLAVTVDDVKNAIKSLEESIKQNALDVSVEQNSAQADPMMGEGKMVNEGVLGIEGVVEVSNDGKGTAEGGINTENSNVVKKRKMVSDPTESFMEENVGKKRKVPMQLNEEPVTRRL